MIGRMYNPGDLLMIKVSTLSMKFMGVKTGDLFVVIEYSTKHHEFLTAHLCHLATGEHFWLNRLFVNDRDLFAQVK